MKKNELRQLIKEELLKEWSANAEFDLEKTKKELKKVQDYETDVLAHKLGISWLSAVALKILINRKWDSALIKRIVNVSQDIEHP